MNNNDFLKKENIGLLWEVISEDDVMRDQEESVKNQVYRLFASNVQGFYESNKVQNISLINMNKTYIRLIINYIHSQMIQDKKTSSPERKDTISFETDLTRKQNEFTSAMTKPVPPVPKFSDKIDEPMSEMALAIKLAQEQRNYDTEQVKKSFTTNNADWLKSQETSVQNDKVTKKFIKINEKEEFIDNGIIDLNKQQQKDKHISWQENQLTEIIPDFPLNNDNIILEGIFNKLKKVQVREVEVPLTLDEKVDSLIGKVNVILQILQERQLL
jgi:hypothetical protein